jgi:hypothetical protein
VALAVAHLVADGQIFGMAVAAVAQGLNVLERGGLGRDMLAADPARHAAMQLPGHSSVDFDSGVAQAAHSGIVGQKQTVAAALRWARLKIQPPAPSALALD